MECKICGKDFELKLDNHYIVRDEEIQRFGIASIVGSSTEKESKLYDAFNCPYCGCQNVVQERKRGFISMTSVGHPDEVCFIKKESEEETEEEQEETEEESGGESTENMINCSHYHCTDCQDEPHCDWAVNDKKENVCIMEVEVRG